MLKRSLTILVSLAAVTQILCAQTQPASQFRVVLLGTGSPAPVLDRFGPSTFVEAGAERLVFDAGRGAMQRLYQIQRGNTNALFLTHLHSDHVVGIPDLWLTGWLVGPGPRDVPLRVWGPEGTAAMAGHLAEAFAFDIAIRISDDRRPAEGAQFDVHEVKEGVVYERAGVRVTAFDVDHRPIAPAFGYRVDYAGHSVVLSGDTRFSEHLVEMARGADLLIHEVSGRKDTSITQANNRVLAHHTMPDQAGEVFTRVHPKLAVYSHVSGNLSDDELIARTRKTYNGPLVVGKDLMTFEIGDKLSKSAIK